MSLLLALHIGLVIGLDGSLPDKINPPLLEQAPKCRLSKMEESMSRFLAFAVIVNNIKQKIHPLKSEMHTYH